SVGGLVFTRLGRLPRTGDTVTADGWQLTVEATRGTRVVLVAIEPAEGRRDEPGRNGTGGSPNGDGPAP
ncbi:MAG TPA: transporter associated domain-containing protein, partial [Miltoncostaeaceae bacterium]|nr:transporter associated domain-containing protein [Miltoncostaeaceae bacterium]